MSTVCTELVNQTCQICFCVHCACPEHALSMHCVACLRPVFRVHAQRPALSVQRPIRDYSHLLIEGTTVLRLMGVGLNMLFALLFGYNCHLIDCGQRYNIQSKWFRRSIFIH